MLKFLIIIYIIFSFLLILLILINKGKSSDTGGLTLDSMNNMFGSKESSSIFNKIIVFLAVFLLLNIFLINLTNNKINKNEFKNTTDIVKNIDKLNNS